MLIAGGVIVAGIAGYIILSGQDRTVETTQPTQKESVMQTDQENGVQEETRTIVEIASANENFSTLVTAVVEAGLVETLSSEGPFTVFAPTNAAFEKLPSGVLEDLLKDKAALAEVLTYHVVAGKVMASDVVGLESATTVQGSVVQISVENGSVMINDANVIQTDIEASNGVIHVIDTVIIPE